MGGLEIAVSVVPGRKLYYKPRIFSRFFFFFFQIKLFAQRVSELTYQITKSAFLLKKAHESPGCFVQLAYEPPRK